MNRRQKIILIVSGILSLMCAVANILSVVPNGFEDTYKAIRTFSFTAFILTLIQLRKKPN